MEGLSRSLAEHLLRPRGASDVPRRREQRLNGTKTAQADVAEFVKFCPDIDQLDDAPLGRL